MLMTVADETVIGKTIVKPVNPKARFPLSELTARDNGPS